MRNACYPLKRPLLEGLMALLLAINIDSRRKSGPPGTDDSLRISGNSAKMGSSSGT